MKYLTLLCAVFIIQVSGMSQTTQFHLEYSPYHSIKVKGEEPLSFSSVAFALETEMRNVLSRVDFQMKGLDFFSSDPNRVQSFYSGSVGIGKVFNKKSKFQIPLIFQLGYTTYSAQDLDIKVHGVLLGSRLHARYFLTDHFAITFGGTYAYNAIVSFNDIIPHSSENLSANMTQLSIGVFYTPHGY